MPGKTVRLSPGTGRRLRRPTVDWPLAATYAAPYVGTVTDDVRKYLEMIQAVISRLANNTFVLKGWAVTLASALFGFAGKQQDAELALLTLFPGLVFWSLDGYYLALERSHRELFARAATGQSPVFSFDAVPVQFRRWWRACWSLPTLLVHGLIVALSAVLWWLWH